MLVLFKSGVDIDGCVPRSIGVTGQQSLSFFMIPYDNILSGFRAL